MGRTLCKDCQEKQAKFCMDCADRWNEIFFRKKEREDLIAKIEEIDATIPFSFNCDEPNCDCADIMKKRILDFLKQKEKIA